MVSRFSKFSRKPRSHAFTKNFAPTLVAMDAVVSARIRANIFKFAGNPRVSKSQLYARFPSYSTHFLDRVTKSIDWRARTKSIFGLKKKPAYKKRKPKKKKVNSSFHRNQAGLFMADFQSRKFTDTQLMKTYGISFAKFQELTGRLPRN
ncbi:MAG: hypothetical protein Q7S92_04940 [Candidatus Diapherotrites archaeon]|nr:hypothetical protein [Candidatus Diapherotrites archaeon]